VRPCQYRINEACPRGFFLRSEGDGGIGWAMIEMLRIYSKGFLENVTIEELVP
jgi:hypothetical protein